jgi:hypothetical protein
MQLKLKFLKKAYTRSADRNTQNPSDFVLCCLLNTEYGKRLYKPSHTSKRQKGEAHV